MDKCFGMADIKLDKCCVLVDVEMHVLHLACHILYCISEDKLNIKCNKMCMNFLTIATSGKINIFLNFCKAKLEIQAFP